jgi:hypothetical protein
MYSQRGKIFLSGDFNSRTSSKADFIQFDHSIDINDVITIDTPTPRISRDLTSNHFGDSLLDLCKATNQRIVNGRWPGDRGNFTCLTHNGASVVDYLLTCLDNFNLLENFSVGEFNAFSNHAPLSFSFKINTVYREPGKDNRKHTYYKFDSRQKESFVSDIINNIESLIHDLNSEIRCEGNVDTLTTIFTNFLCDHGNKYFRKTSNLPNVCFEDGKNKQDWYDENCEHKYNAYKKAVCQFNLTHSDNDRALLYETKKDYKYQCRKSRNAFNYSRSRKMNELRSKSPREFWRIFKQGKTTNYAENISNEEFMTHFSNLMSGGDSHDEDEYADLIGQFDINIEHSTTFESLDLPITNDEILKAIKKLGSNKAPSIDNVLYEYFKVSVPCIIEPLSTFFNHILDSKSFPRSWASGVIIPIYKKGNQSDPNNYRGITLTSCFSKLFTVILNERLKQWAEENSILTDAQFGFKNKYSTVDPVFILHSLIQKQFENKKHLFCCFIDYKRAYDYIDRNRLWYKLIKLGIDGKFLSLVRSMYSEVKLCVKHMGTLSDFFNSNLGLFQGEITSPILFSLFLNDIEIHLQENINVGINFDNISIYLLLFADDAVIVSETREGLQNSLDSLYSYCCRWNLTVNVDKTKIMVFRKGGRLDNNSKWFFNNQEIEIVGSFNYLGVVFTSGGSFMQATKTLAGKGLRSLHALMSLVRNMKVPLNIMFNLFDSYVLSVLNYGSEVWGFFNSEVLERVQKKFCKWVLNVKQSTNTLALYGELGRFPLYIERYIRMVKYFLKLHSVKQDNCILNVIIRDQMYFTEQNFVTTNWASRVREILQSSGLNEVWLYPNSVKINWFVPILRNRLRDIYISNWREGLESYSSLYIYREIKTCFNQSSYLMLLENTKYRNILAKLRLSSHKLNIELGRYNNIPRNERKCILCNLNDIEDEFHFVLKCPVYADLRRQYIPKYYYTQTSVMKYILLMQTSNKTLLKKLAMYCDKSFKLRDSLIL